jgi:hypothetical protein
MSTEHNNKLHSSSPSNLEQVQILMTPSNNKKNDSMMCQLLYTVYIFLGLLEEYTLHPMFDYCCKYNAKAHPNHHHHRPKKV